MAGADTRSGVPWDGALGPGLAGLSSGWFWSSRELPEKRQVGAGQFLNKKWPFQVSHPFKEAGEHGVETGSQPGSWAAALIPSIPSGLWQALTTSPVQVLIWKGEVRTGTCKPLQP